MGMKESMHEMQKLLCEIAGDLEKVIAGNRAAAQRVRTGSIHFEKIAKRFRKESVAAEKTGVFKKAKVAARKAPKKAAPKAASKAKPKAKTKAKAKPAKKAVRRSAKSRRR